MDKKENNKMVLTYAYREIYRQLCENKKLNRYDYYMLGGVNIIYASSILYELFRAKKLTIYEYETLRCYINMQLKIGIASKNKQFIINTHYQFGDTVITEEEKNSIWEDLASHIDEKCIDDLVFSGAVRAYALEKGLIKKQDTHKKLVKKK